MSATIAVSSRTSCRSRPRCSSSSIIFVQHGRPPIEHFKGYADFIANTLGVKTAVEFGCNDGIELEQLRARGVKATGVDYSENITAIARGKGLDVVTGLFVPETARAIRERIGAVDYVTGSNCFAHFHRPETALEAARVLLKPDGLLGLEVMYAGDLLEKLQWDTLYHEHLTVLELGYASVPSSVTVSTS